MTILLFSTDLMVQSLVAAAASRAGLGRPKLCNSIPATPTSEFADCTLAILDLSMPGLDVAQTVSSLRPLLQPSAPIAAFAPHVHEAKLAAARAAGCDIVLSRGQLDREIDAILERRLS